MHIKKYNYHAAIKTIYHDLRKHETYRNEDIDPSKTKDNLILHDIDPLEKMKKRIDEIYIYGKNGKHKNDINYICSVCVQYPEGCNLDEDEFFNAMDCVLSKRFGSKNRISSVVHKDEKGKVHLHYKFMPVIYNKQKNREELCAKKVVNRSMLLTFHKDVENDLKSLGYDIKLHDPDKHIGKTNIKDIEEYKKLQDILNSKQKEIKEIEQILSSKLEEKELIELGKKSSIIDKVLYGLGKLEQQQQKKILSITTQHEEEKSQYVDRISSLNQECENYRKTNNKIKQNEEKIKVVKEIEELTNQSINIVLDNLRYIEKAGKLDKVKYPKNEKDDKYIKIQEYEKNIDRQLNISRNNKYNEEER